MVESADETVTESVTESVTGALDALDGLDERPVGEHLAAFEQAHRELRSALDLGHS